MTTRVAVQMEHLANLLGLPDGSVVTDIERIPDGFVLISFTGSGWPDGEVDPILGRAWTDGRLSVDGYDGEPGVRT